MTLDPDLFSLYLNRIITILADYTPRLAAAFAILFIGIIGIRILNGFIQKLMVKRSVEPTLASFLSNILLWTLRIMLFVVFVEKLGVATSSFVAILGAAGLAIGLSLQGSLSNFAGGVLIILFKPFRVGDTIEAQAEVAKVLEIQIFTTKLLTASNQVVYIPNGILSNNKIKNYSQNDTRRADLVVKINYDTNLAEVKKRLLSIMENHPLVLKNPSPEIIINDLTDTGINLVLRPWSLLSNYGSMTTDIYEKSLMELDQIEKIPYAKSLSENLN